MFKRKILKDPIFWIAENRSALFSVPANFYFDADSCRKLPASKSTLIAIRNRLAKGGNLTVLKFMIVSLLS